VGGAEIGVIISALGAVFAAVVGGIRSLRSDKVSAAETRQANLMAGYEGLMDGLRQDMRRLREEHTAERQSWHEERLHLTGEIARLEERVRAAIQDARAAADRLERRLEETTEERDRFARENQSLKAEVQRLEGRVAELERRS
jgi:DNA repair exonuclease SbcCD ATPase subunit